jgi:hypothetical protein
LIDGRFSRTPKIARRRSARIVDENIRIRTGGVNGAPSLLCGDVGYDRNGFRAGFSRRALQDFAALAAPASACADAMKWRT